MSLFHKIALGGAMLFATTAAYAQPTPAAAPAPAAPAPLAIPNPTYTTLVLEIDVNKPAADVWKRVGKYCDIEEWFGLKCEITAGVAGELGSVRVLNGAIIEPLVGKTDLSYVYTQPVRVGVPYNLYHGGLEAKPVTATTSKLIYTFVYDNSMLADDAARAAELTNRRNRFTPAMEKMKALAEAG